MPDPLLQSLPRIQLQELLLRVHDETQRVKGELVRDLLSLCASLATVVGYLADHSDEPDGGWRSNWNLGICSFQSPDCEPCRFHFGQQVLILSIRDRSHVVATGRYRLICGDDTYVDTDTELLRGHAHRYMEQFVDRLPFAVPEFLDRIFAVGKNASPLVKEVNRAVQE